MLLSLSQTEAEKISNSADYSTFLFFIGRWLPTKSAIDGVYLD